MKTVSGSPYCIETTAFALLPPAARARCQTGANGLCVTSADAARGGPFRGMRARIRRTAGAAMPFVVGVALTVSPATPTSRGGRRRRRRRVETPARNLASWQGKGRQGVRNPFGPLLVEKYVLDDAVAALKGTVDAAAISPTDAAETFANVANAMVVTIVELASLTLVDLKKEGGPAVALDVVIDFMEHAAGLFLGVVGEGVTIEPNMYLGAFAKGNPEQLF